MAVFQNMQNAEIEAKHKLETNPITSNIMCYLIQRSHLIAGKLKSLLSRSEND